jgi:Arc/MetJ family transcription regulator
MAMTSVDLDDALLRAAMRALGARTKREAITTALTEVVRRHAQVDALEAVRSMTFTRDLLNAEIRAQARR